MPTESPVDSNGLPIKENVHSSRCNFLSCSTFSQPREDSNHRGIRPIVMLRI